MKLEALGMVMLLQKLPGPSRAVSHSTSPHQQTSRLGSVMDLSLTCLKQPECYCVAAAHSALQMLCTGSFYLAGTCCTCRCPVLETSVLEKNDLKYLWWAVCQGGIAFPRSLVVLTRLHFCK